MQQVQGHQRRAVILTAIPVEYQAVRRHLQYLHEIVHKGTVYEQGMFVTQGGACEIGIAQIHAGNARAAAEAERAITYFAPRFALFVGVAGGLKDVRIGDVVIATKVYSYEAGKEETTFRPRPEVGLSSYALIQRAQAEANRSAWLQRLGDPIPQPPPRAIIAPIAAGEKVQASTRSTTYRSIKVNYSDAVAVEMEGHGFLLALHANPQVDALVIRGISNLIDGKSEADAAHSQEIAACHASSFAFEVLAKLTSWLDNVVTCLKTTDDAQVMPPLVPLSQQGASYHLQNHGLNTGIIQQGSNHGIQNFITYTSSKDEEAEGIIFLQRGQAALLQEDYPAAKHHLSEAARLLCEDLVPAEGALLRYLQALACLEGKRPFGLTLPVMRRVEQLMERAVAFHATHAFLYAFALFKQDFARNRWRESKYLQEAQTLMQRAQETPLTPEDEHYLALLSRCQPRLIQDAQQC